MGLAGSAAAADALDWPRCLAADLAAPWDSMPLLPPAAAPSVAPSSVLPPAPLISSPIRASMPPSGKSACISSAAASPQSQLDAPATLAATAACLHATHRATSRAERFPPSTANCTATKQLLACDAQSCITPSLDSSYWISPSSSDSKVSTTLPRSARRYCSTFCLSPDARVLVGPTAAIKAPTVAASAAMAQAALSRNVSLAVGKDSIKAACLPVDSDCTRSASDAYSSEAALPTFSGASC